MFASFALMVEILCFVTVVVAQKHIILLVLIVMKHFFGQRADGIVDGIYVVFVRRMHITCVIPAPIHYARGA
nr:Zinc finger CCCH domain-containing protein 44 [Ipomoea batatas]